MQKIIISCKTNDEIKYGVAIEDGLKLNNNALELELTNEELNVLTNRLFEFRDRINGIDKSSGTTSKEEIESYVRGLIDETNNALEINKILKIKKLEELEEEYYILNDKLEKTKAFLGVLEKQLF